MSTQALFWALERARPRDSRCKLTLIVLANFANEAGEAYPSIPTVERLSNLDAKTVRSALERLEADGFISDTGKRVGKQKNVRVLRLEIPTLPDPAGLKPSKFLKPGENNGIGSAKAPTLPDPALLDSEGSGSGSPTLPDPAGEPLIGTSPLEANASVPTGDQAAKASNGRSTRIDPEWQAPDQASLPLDVRGLVSAWPAGAYEAQACAFVDYWAAESGVKAHKVDWNRAWNSWIRNARHVTAPANPEARILGVPVAPMPSPTAPVVQQLEEGEREAVLRAALEIQQPRPSWLARCGLRVARLDDAGLMVGVTIFVPAGSQHAAERSQGSVRLVASKALGATVDWLHVIVGRIGK